MKTRSSRRVAVNFVYSLKKKENKEKVHSKESDQLIKKEMEKKYKRRNCSISMAIIRALFYLLMTAGVFGRRSLHSFKDLRHLPSSERVVGGVAAKHGQFPWAVFIHAKHRFANNSDASNLCGGSLIHPR